MPGTIDGPLGSEYGSFKEVTKKQTPIYSDPHYKDFKQKPLIFGNPHMWLLIRVALTICASSHFVSLSKEHAQQRCRQSRRDRREPHSLDQRFTWGPKVLSIYLVTVLISQI